MKRILITCPSMHGYDPGRVEGLEFDFRLPPGGQCFSAGELIALGVERYDGAAAGDDEWVEEVFRAAPRLRIVSKFGHGTDSVDREAATRRGIAVTNTPGVFSDAVAEAALGYMIFLTRGLHLAHRAVLDGLWVRHKGRGLGSLVVGVVGVGNIGRAFARRAAALGARVVGSDPVRPPVGFLTETGMEMLPPAELLSCSDVISLHCDLNPTSRDLIGEEAFAAIRRGAFLINTARGAVVDEQALVGALEDGVLGGAALDVFRKEPLPPDSPLRTLPNVILGAHGSFFTAEAVRRASEWTLRNCIQHLSAGEV